MKKRVLLPGPHHARRMLNLIAHAERKVGRELTLAFVEGWLAESLGGGYSGRPVLTDAEEHRLVVEHDARRRRP